MLKNTTVQLMALGLVGSFVATAAAQDSGALIDALVKKGVLKDQEAEDIRAQMTRDFATNTSAGKINLSSSVKELKISGDVRLRDVYDQQQNQAGTDTAQKNRYRLRLRVNADYRLNDDWFAGFGLQTTQNNDSGNQTMANGATGGDYFQNYNIYLNKAFIGWNPVNGATLIGGKQPNPFYTTDLVWDGDINPTGFSQRLDLHKMFSLGGLELSVVAGQLVVSDNAENTSTTAAAGAGRGANRDAFIYQTQVIASANVFDGYKLTIAPGFYCSNGAKTAGNGGGQANPAAGEKALDGLKVILLPGDVSFKLAGKPAKVLWDVAYNQDATDRSAVYGVARSKATGTDKLAYLLGFQIGENKKKGDWSVLANYRKVGLSSIDTNINDSDWAESFTNMSGYKVGFLYNLGDATSIGATYFNGNNARTSLGSVATVSTQNSVQVLQLDLNVKF